MRKHPLDNVGRRVIYSPGTCESPDTSSCSSSQREVGVSGRMRDMPIYCFFIPQLRDAVERKSYLLHDSSYFFQHHSCDLRLRVRWTIFEASRASLTLSLTFLHCQSGIYPFKIMNKEGAESKRRVMAQNIIISSCVASSTFHSSLLRREFAKCLTFQFLPTLLIFSAMKETRSEGSIIMKSQLGNAIKVLPGVR